MRYLAAQEAVSDWANTAAYCPARFADGTLRSAQARHTARLMAARLTINIAQPTLSRCDGIDSFDIDTDSLSAMSVAEDQAGFAMGVFAARSIGHATLENKQLDYSATALSIVKSSYEIFAMSAIVRRVLSAWMMRHLVRLAVAQVSRRLLYELACAGVCWCALFEQCFVE